MVAALPFAKLGTLLVKTLAKPVSKRIKKDFSRFESTKRALVSIGQTQHSVTSRLSIWSEGYTVRRISPLEDDKALSNGADFVGESFVLMVSMGTVVWEYNRSNEKSKEKEAKLQAQAKAERDALQANFQALDERLKAVEEVVEYNSTSMLNISGKRYVEPKEKKKDLVRISGDLEEARQDLQQMQQPKPDEDMTTPNEKAAKSWWFW